MNPNVDCSEATLVSAKDNALGPICKEAETVLPQLSRRCVEAGSETQQAFALREQGHRIVLEPGWRPAARVGRAQHYPQEASDRAR